MISAGFLVVSCTSDSDTTAPTIEILAPKANDTIVLGNNLDLKFRFTDNYGVSYYSYDIFSETPTVLGAFTYFKEVNLSGGITEYEIPHSVFIPKKYNDSIPTLVGDYTIRVIAIDMYGNKNFVDQPLKIEPAQ